MKEGVQVAILKIQLLLSCDIKMRRSAGNDWFKTENLHFVLWTLLVAWCGYGPPLQVKFLIA